MKHPLEFVPERLRKSSFYFFFAFTLLIFGIFMGLDVPLQTDAAPGGMVSFELAFRADLSQGMVDSWNPEAKLAAAFGLGFDYLFMPVYSLALALGLLLARSDKRAFYFSFVNFMGWGAFAAALFDAVENFALWHILTQGTQTPYPQLAAVCATLKFTLLIVGLVTALAGSFLRK